MQRIIFNFLFIIISILISGVSLMAQEERKVSVSLYTGIAFFPKDVVNAASLSTRALGGFKPTPVVGLGLYYRLSKRMSLGENYMLLFNTKADNRKLTNQSFRTTLKYHIIANRKFNPYVMASLNINRLTIDREEKEYSYVPDSSANVIGSGISVDSIYYREKALKLSGLPILGASLGAGFEFKLNKRLNVFAEYNIHANLGKNNALLKQYYFSNESNLTYHTITAGVNYKLFKPQKQLLASLSEDDWRNSKSIDVKGTIVYKNPIKHPSKLLPVEKTDTLGNIIDPTPTEEKGLVFISKNITPGDYQFMLPKKNRKVLRADLQILNYNRIEIQDDELELDMVEDEGSENILSRDANFAVLLREGFQHEVELTTTAENIMGTYTPKDPLCKVRIILKDQYDSIISYIDTLDNNTFNFVDIVPGNYKLSFQKMENGCKQAEFTYGFTGAAPYIKKQSNTDLPEEEVKSYLINGIVSSSKEKPNAPKGTVVKLIDPSGRIESSSPLAGPKADFNYTNLNSPNYAVAFEDPTSKASMDYKVKDNGANLIREGSSGPPQKVVAVEGSYLVKGKVALANETQASTVSVLLIDSTGKIKQKVPVAPDGTFAFDNLPKNKYKVAYESTDPLLRGTLKYTARDKNVKVTKFILPELTATIQRMDTVKVFNVDTIQDLPVNNTSTLTNNQVTKEPVVTKEPEVVKDSVVVKEPVLVKEPEVVKDTVVVKEPEVVKEPVVIKEPEVVKEPVVVPEKKRGKEVPVKYPFTQFKPNVTYNDQGYEVKPEGYGIQVASFIINSNLEKFCQRLRDKGERNIFIQVIEKDKNDPAAGLIYRVIIGADDDKEKMMKKIPSTMDKGYNAVLRKHQ